MTFIFQNIWDNLSRWLIFFKMVKTTNQLYNIIYIYIIYNILSCFCILTSLVILMPTVPKFHDLTFLWHLSEGVLCFQAWVGGDLDQKLTNILTVQWKHPETLLEYPYRMWFKDIQSISKWYRMSLTIETYPKSRPGSSKKNKTYCTMCLKGKHRHSYTFMKCVVKLWHEWNAYIHIGHPGIL